MRSRKWRGGGAGNQVLFGRPFIHEPAAAARGRNVGAVNRSVTVRAAVGQWQARPVMVAGMALQAQRRLAHRQQVRVGRPMGRVAQHAVFRHRGMLISVRPAILRMAAEAELVHVRGSQIVATRPAMGIVAIHAANLALAQRVMIRHAKLRALGRVTLQAGVVGFPHRPHDHIGFGRHRSCR